MKSKNTIHVNSVLFLVLFMVLCPGKNEALAQSEQVKAQLHVPWNLLSERLRAIANLHSSDGSETSTPIGSRLIPVSFQGETINWNLTSGTVQAAADVDQAVIAASSANVSIKSAEIRIVLEQLTVDQVIVRDIGGVQVRVHLNAACGPITLHQPKATALGVFEINWAGGSPSASLATLDLGWAPGSWTFNDFTCTGPSGLDALVHDGIASYLRDPSDFKPYVKMYIADHLAVEIDSVLAKIRAPFAAAAGSEAISINVGVLAPVATGVVGDLTLKTDSKSISLPPAPLPPISVLSSLSKTEPALIGDMSVIEFIVGAKLRAQPAYYRFNLQTVDAFHSLMSNRLAQIFVWADLLNYSSDAPFYLALFNPRQLSLTHSGGSALSSTIPVRSVIQSYRDSQWWSWVNTKGTSDLSVALSVNSGRLSYGTTVNSLVIKSQYGAAYTKRYNKESRNLPDDLVAKALTGARPELSGSMQFPDIDLDLAGKYRADSLSWANNSTFSLNFAPAK